MKLPALLACTALLSPLPGSADVWLCQGADQKHVIQDRPCARGMRQKSHVSGGSHVVAPSTVRSATKPSPGKPAIEVGLQRNKGIICSLLATEKTEALAQISGSRAPAPGENPRENLQKIEKQRTRVGCDAG